jgi:hypothetical protein
MFGALEGPRTTARRRIDIWDGESVAMSVVLAKVACCRTARVGHPLVAISRALKRTMHPVDASKMANHIASKAAWLRRHLSREKSKVLMLVPEVEVVSRINQAIAHGSPLGADRATRKALQENGFVTGTFAQARRPATFKLSCYRPSVWMGRLAPFFDQDRLAKPTLRGEISGDQSHTTVSYRVDAFGTSVSWMVFILLGVPALIAGILVSLLDPMPMPSLGFVFLVFSGVFLIAAFNIWRAVDSAILDEEYLVGWLSHALDQ